MPTDNKPENTVADEPTSAELTNTEQTSAEAPAPEQTTTPEPTAKGNNGRVLPIVLAALCVVAAVVVVLLGLQAKSASDAKADSDAALDAARTRSVFVLSYAPATVDADIAKDRAQLSGTFAAQFDQLVNSVVLPATKQQGLASKVDVTHSAMMESHPDRADVLLMMHQVVTSNNQQPQEGTIQVKVTVTKTPDGQWLISSLQPI